MHAVPLYHADSSRKTRARRCLSAIGAFALALVGPAAGCSVQRVEIAVSALDASSSSLSDASNASSDGAVEIDDADITPMFSDATVDASEAGIVCGGPPMTAVCNFCPRGYEQVDGGPSCKCCP